MLRMGWALAAVVFLAASGCGGGNEDGANTGRSGEDRESSELRGLCGDGESPRKLLNEEFRAGRLLPGVEGVRLVLDRTVVRPGDRFNAIVANRSDRQVHYGVSYEFQRRTEEGWERVPGTPDVFIMIALVADPGSLGPCVPLEVPERGKPGHYRALVGSARPPGDEVGGRLIARFEVREQP